MKRKQAQKKAAVRGQMRALTAQQVSTIEGFLAQEEDWRSLAIFRTAVDTMLRASDLMTLTVQDVTSDDGKVMEEIAIRQQKTHDVVDAFLSSETREAIRRWLAVRPQLWGGWLFTGRHEGEHLSESQYRRETKRWFRMARLDTRFYSTHSLRRTKAALIYARTGNVEVVRQLLGHSSLQATFRYLGVMKADALKVAREVRI